MEIIETDMFTHGVLYMVVLKPKNIDGRHSITLIQDRSILFTNIFKMNTKRGELLPTKVTREYMVEDSIRNICDGLEEWNRIDISDQHRVVIFVNNDERLQEIRKELAEEGWEIEELYRNRTIHISQEIAERYNIVVSVMYFGCSCLHISTSNENALSLMENLGEITTNEGFISTMRYTVTITLKDITENTRYYIDMIKILGVCSFGVSLGDDVIDAKALLEKIL